MVKEDKQQWKHGYIRMMQGHIAQKLLNKLKEHPLEDDLTVLRAESADWEDRLSFCVHNPQQVCYLVTPPTSESQHWYINGSSVVEKHVIEWLDFSELQTPFVHLGTTSGCQLHFIPLARNGFTPQKFLQAPMYNLVDGELPMYWHGLVRIENQLGVSMAMWSGDVMHLLGAFMTKRIEARLEHLSPIAVLSKSMASIEKAIIGG